MTDSNDERLEELTREALAWLAKFSLGETSEDDVAALRQWRDQSPAHAAALAKAGRLWRGLTEPVGDLVRRGAVSVPISDNSRHVNRRHLFVGFGGAAAAVVGMAVKPPLDMWPSLAELRADRRTGTGEQQHLTLPHAVSVDLNTRTSITLRTTGQEPGIELITGELAVRIDKAAGKPFVVAAANGFITASLGAFNVRRDGLAVRLTCVDGEVSVDCRGGLLRLVANQQVSYDDQGLGQVVTTDAAITTAWRDGVLVFENTPLLAVIEEVNRYRSGHIILVDSALGQKLVTARFEIKRLDKVMNQICNVFSVPVRTLPGGIVLVG